MQKTYKSGLVTYGYSKTFKKWQFQAPLGFVLVQACHGATTAHKVANIVTGAFKRSGQFDALARKNVFQVCGC